MKAVEIMVSALPTISRKASIKEAVLMMKTNIGNEDFLNSAPNLIVVNENGDLAGILTPLTLISALIDTTENKKIPIPKTPGVFNSLSKNIMNMLVEDIMERQPISITEDALLPDVSELLVQHKFQMIPVVKDKKVVGIVYHAPLLFYMADSFFN